MPLLEARPTPSAQMRLLAPLIAIGLTLAVGSLLFLSLGKSPVEAFGVFFIQPLSSGNGWSEPQTLAVFPRIDDLASIVPVDLLGNGTACLVWSSSLPSDVRRPMRYVNLMGEVHCMGPIVPGITGSDQLRSPTVRA